MPFLGQDWRSPGDQWVRTTVGWERLRLWRLKVFENLNENALARLIRLALLDTGPHSHTTERRQPYIFYNKGTTRERKELTSISETLLRLDMTGAVKDIRRSNYVCKLLQLIFAGKLPNLSGTAQKHVLHILEATVQEAMRSELNIGLVRKLLQLADRALHEGHISHIGSSCLWNQHNQTLSRLSNQFGAYKLKERDEDNGVMFSDLPLECIRSILFRIADHKDLVHTGLTMQLLRELTREEWLWRELCLFHFTNRQILTFLPKGSGDLEQDNIDWKYIYMRCFKRFGQKEEYADMLAMCAHCCSIYWQSLGHPCTGDNGKNEQLLTPEDFIKLFPL